MNFQPAAKTTLGGRILPRIAPKPPQELDVKDVVRPPQHPITSKRTRTSKPKVRTGCLTCKIRRVKCDEGKPRCKTCQVARVVCDGYSTSPSPKQRQTRPAPSSIFRPAATSSIRVLAPCPHPRLGPPTGVFSPEQVPYFDFFRLELTRDLSGDSCTDFWSRVVLCDAMSSDCVRHAVLAISALAKAISSSLKNAPSKDSPSALRPWTTKSIMDSNHHLALRHHLAALSVFKHRIGAPVENRSVREILVMTILLLTFEFMQGNMEMADGLMTTSIHLLESCLTQYRGDSMKKRRPDENRKLEDDVGEIEYMLPFLSIMGGWTPFLKMQSANLALWETSAGDLLPNLAHCSPTVLQAEWGRFFSRAASFTGRALATVMQAGSFVDPELLRQQKIYLSQVETWQQAMKAAATRTATNAPRARRAIRLMQIQCLVVDIGLRCCLDPTDMVWDQFEAEFARVVDQCFSFALEEPRPAYHARFTLSMGVLSTLGPAIAKCRNHDIRMEALEMVRRMPWREGSWDAEAELFGKLGAVLLEETGRNDDGRIPAEGRWTWLDGDWDTKQGTLVGRYLRSVPDEHGAAVITTLELGLDAWPDICSAVSCNVDHAVRCRKLG